MKLTKQQLENKIKNFNDWLQYHNNGIHFEYAKNKKKRDYYVDKLLELEKSGDNQIEIHKKNDTEQPIERDTIDLKEYKFY